MFTLEELQKDLETYMQKQAELREHFANLTGAIQLLTLQINKLKELEAVEVESNTKQLEQNEIDSNADIE